MRSCKACKTRFEGKGFVVWCSPECGSIIARQRLDKKKAQAAKEDRKTTRVKLEKLKTRSEWMKEAQIAFNAWIRARDAGKPCICCGAPLADGAIGGGYDAGHYRSVGSAPHLRFEENNCHAQAKKCNRYGAGRAVDYRKGLIHRIGVAAVESIEADQTPRHYDISDLKAIKEKYKKMARELKKNAA